MLEQCSFVIGLNGKPHVHVIVVISHCLVQHLTRYNKAGVSNCTLNATGNVTVKRLNFRYKFYDLHFSLIALFC